MSKPRGNKTIELQIKSSYSDLVDELILKGQTVDIFAKENDEVCSGVETLIDNELADPFLVIEQPHEHASKSEFTASADVSGGSQNDTSKKVSLKQWKSIHIFHIIELPK
eukprot:2788885-Ditylum_brightwellii.AAC.1